MSQQPPQQTSSGWSKTKSGFSAVGKGASSARTGINSGLAKLDNISISSKGLSTKKNMSAGNVLYDRDNHVVAPKMDVSHLPPPPRRIPGATPPINRSPASGKSVNVNIPAKAASPAAVPAKRLVPPPPPATQAKPTIAPPAYNSAMLTEAKGAMSSAQTVGSLYGKYGNQAQGKTATPSWAEVKAGAAAAQNLNSLHNKYAKPQPVAAPIATKPSVGPPPPVLATRPPPLPKNKPAPKDYCIGLYSFEAQGPGDLSFDVGDKIEVLERTADPDAWWRGRLNGKEGIFPANYCKLETH